MGILWNASLVLGTAVAVGYLPRIFMPKPPFRDMEGWIAPGFRKVADTFRNSLRDGSENGAAFAAYYKGNLVVSLRGGYADYEAEQPWAENTLSLFFSATKGPAAVIVARCVESGLLDYDQPVSKYWPEFAQHGKENITVKQLITHQAGLITTPDPITVKDVQDYRTLGDRLAALKPYWPQGTGHGYHAVTWGLYIDQLVRKVDPKHRGLQQYWKEEIGLPFDIDFHIGLPRSEHYRVAHIHSPSVMEQLKPLLNPGILKLFYQMTFNKDVYITKVFASVQWLSKMSYYNNPYIREVDLASGLGYGTAESLARFYGLLTTDAINNGQRILSRETVKKFIEPTISGKDLVIPYQDHVNALGMILVKNPQGQYVFGHPGIGGQAAYGDLNKQLGWAYLTNFPGSKSWADDARYLKLQDALYECVQDLEKEGKK